MPIYGMGPGQTNPMNNNMNMNPMNNKVVFEKIYFIVSRNKKDLYQNHTNTFEI